MMTTAFTSIGVVLLAFILHTLLGRSTLKSWTPQTTPRDVLSQPIITDLNVYFASTSKPEQEWECIDKELYLHTSRKKAWLCVNKLTEEDLTEETFVITDIRIGEKDPVGHGWESRNAGIWMKRTKYADNVNISNVVTDVDVLFGLDAVDPRPLWTLTQPPLQLEGKPDVPVSMISVLHGRAQSQPDRVTLRVKDDGKFRILQISDTHMGTGVGICEDSIDEDGHEIPESEADTRTVEFIKDQLDIEKPDLVVFTGDQLHHDIEDSQSALFKVVAPIIDRSIPFAAVFGNHDSEGKHALSRKEQMSILEKLPLSLCEAGPENADGVGNFVLRIFAQAPLQQPLSNLYFLDSHGQKPTFFRNDYDPIQQSQIDWFLATARAEKVQREKLGSDKSPLSLAFLHIPLPEFADDRRLHHFSGNRREPTEGPSVNTHFYDALVEAGVLALGCGHDHVNDFCALRIPDERSESSSVHRPWLCYGGGSGFGGYCSYGKKRFYRRVRVWELDTRFQRLTTWTRQEYSMDRIDELMLVDKEALSQRFPGN